ncbi:MAG TPA: hypothetical protein VKI44_29405 [Acetobacteraceae bacterium]|nr:hypothetical protein [Acetobacteraceae bacterium]
MTPIAIAADQGLRPAGRLGAEEQPGLRVVTMAARAIIMRRTAAWTRAEVAAILPLQSCSCTV